MPEIESEVIFEVGEDGAKFTTQSNGDIIIITGIHLTKEKAATLAWLVNSKKVLMFEVKEKP
ncbi:hypothetical protein LCGC14_2762390 [marine sediment metagenome]|uniref:Uncharacterized protein n=1 Tax=marine sediment metagenome TaxID=412755 RepID=A0A0F8YYJ2_9ZZZZ